MFRTASAKVQITRIYSSKEGEKGVRAQVKIGEINALLRVGYDGQLADKIKESVGKCLALVGTFRLKKDVPLPIFEVSGELESRVVLSGRLTRDAELKYSTKGAAYTQFSIATDYGWGDRKETDFINCTLFGNEKEKNAAVALAEKGRKGRQIMISGRLTQNEKDGKTYTNLIADEFEFVGPAKNGQAKNSPAEETQYEDWGGIGTEIDMGEIDF